MGNLAFQDVNFLLTDIQRSTPNREFLGLQSVQEPTKAVQFIGWAGVVHKPMIGGWPLFDQTANLTASFNLCAATSVLAAPAPCYAVLSGSSHFRITDEGSMSLSQVH